MAAVVKLKDVTDGEDIRAEVGARLRRLRLALGYSDRDQARFAKIAGLSQSAYSNYENGHRLPNLDAALRLKGRFRVTLDWIYTGDLSGMDFALVEKLTKM